MLPRVCLLGSFLGRFLRSPARLKFIHYRCDLFTVYFAVTRTSNNLRPCRSRSSGRWHWHSCSCSGNRGPLALHWSCFKSHSLDIQQVEGRNVVGSYIAAPGATAQGH